MIIYFSGEENLARPEIVFGDDADIMLTFYEIKPQKNGKPSKRFRKIYAKRKQQAERHATSGAAFSLPKDL